MRARRTKATSEEQAARVQTIIEQMRRFEWTTKSAGELAKQWKLHEATVAGLAAEASRAIARALEPEALTQTIKLRMFEIIEHGDARDAVRAADVGAKLLGIYAATKLEISTERAIFEQMPPPEQAKRLREKARELVTAAEEIERGMGIEVKELTQ